jgi:hypothetical protein
MCDSVYGKVIPVGETSLEIFRKAKKHYLPNQVSNMIRIPLKKEVHAVLLT